MAIHLKILMLIFTLLVSCGKVDPKIVNGIPKQDTWILTEQDVKTEPEVAPAPDVFQIQDIQKKEPDASAEYKEECWEAVWLRCPPYEEYWIAEAVIDTCDDFKIIMIDNCRMMHECDPNDPIIAIQTCQTEDGFSGQQYVVCDKGKVDLTDCWPCDDEEICDLEDNDCDGQVDEGTYECTTDCETAPAYCVEGKMICTAEDPQEEICDFLDNDCDDEIDEHQRNACDKCGPVPKEVCDGIDNDCNGFLDENLLQECETVCEKGYEICLSGMWSNCTAQQPIEEYCNGEDDDCDGSIDEGLDCVCGASDVGILIPCMEDPLLCGQGYKTCECAVVPPAGQLCTEFGMTDCKASCFYFPVAGTPCDEKKGIIINELCNNHDDDCDMEIDEDLYKQCYTGPPETLNVGICKPGALICNAGKWGNFLDELFIDDMCFGEVLPLPEELCNGLDDNCDGEIEDDMEDTDILFILDTSGSMSDEIEAIISALSKFALYYSDESVIKWGLIFGPIHEVIKQDSGSNIATESLKIKHDFSGFSSFLTALTTTDFAAIDGSREMLYDAIYLSLYPLANSNFIEYDHLDIAWMMMFSNMLIYSDPPIPSFVLSWRGSPNPANRVVVVLTDENGQSYMEPLITNDILLKLQGGVKDLNVFVFSPNSTSNAMTWNGTYIGWENLCQVGNGQWFELTNDSGEIFNNLMEIIDNTVCE
jgi:hypothetical protein